MKVRSVIVAALAAGLLVPAAARAEHCDSPIYIFSTTRQDTGVDDPRNPGHTIKSAPQPVSSVAGCTVVRDTVIAGEDPTLHPATDTDVIYPGSNSLSVRFFEHGTDPAIIASATVTFAGETYPLTLAPSLDVTGAPSDWLDSQVVTIDPADTFSGNLAVARICTTEDECFERTYRTLG